jgi:hypothetical protein
VCVLISRDMSTTAWKRTLLPPLHRLLTSFNESFGTDSAFAWSSFVSAATTRGVRPRPPAGSQQVTDARRGHPELHGAGSHGPVHALPWQGCSSSEEVRARIVTKSTVCMQICVCASLSPSLPLSLCLCLCRPLSLSLSLTLCLCLCLCLSLSVSVSLSLSLYAPLTHAVTVAHRGIESALR